MPLTEIAPLETMQRGRGKPRPQPRALAGRLDQGDNSRLAPLVSAQSATVASHTRDNRPTGGEDRQQYLPVHTLRQQYLDYLTTKSLEIEEQKEARHYYHGAHWTPDQIRILRARHQPVITYNRTGRKINGIVGLVERLRSDPKALPRTPRHDNGAELAVQTIRYVLDGNDFKAREPECLRQCAIDGIAGVELKLIEGDHGDPDVGLAEVLGDEYFYDPRSIRFDFADKRYDGIAKWIDVEEAIELFPDKEELLRGLVEAGSDLTTNSDREYKWILTVQKRLRLVEHWYKHRGKWCWAFYVSNVVLDEGVSPFRDEKGKTMSRFVMFSAAVDHDGDRYGFVRNLKGPQDEVNQRRSKALHISNSRRLIGEKGAVDDVETARREWARPDGYLEVNPGKQVTPDNTQPDLENQFRFLEEAKNEIDQYGNTNLANLTGAAVTQLSGRAIELLQQPGMAELGPFILAYRGWKLRVYRAIWNIVQQHWTAERWIRVTDDEGVAQFIKLNGVGLDQFGRPVLVNHIGSLDVDIILDEGRDIQNLMQDTYDALKGYPPGTFPPQVLIELSPIPRSDKQRILQMMSPPAAPPADPAAELAKRLALESAAAELEKTRAEARKTHAQTDATEADAAEKRSRIITNAARAAHLATASHLSAAEFARDTLMEAAGQGSTEDVSQPSGVPGSMPLPMPPAAMPTMPPNMGQPAFPMPPGFGP